MGNAMSVCRSGAGILNKNEESARLSSIWYARFESQSL